MVAQSIVALVGVLTGDLDLEEKRHLFLLLGCSRRAKKFDNVEEREGNCWNIVLERRKGLCRV